MPVSINNTTLTFNDATTQTTAGTSNTLTAGTGISVSSPTGASTITNTGVTSVSAGTGISVSAATGGVTISAAGVTSLNGQTGAITNTGFDAIGSYAWVANATSGGVLAGNTIAGSSLYRANTIVTYGDGGQSIVSNGNSGYTPPRTAWYPTNVQRYTTGNTGISTPLGASALSGTWRSMTTNGRAVSVYASKENRTQIDYSQGLWVRIS